MADRRESGGSSHSTLDDLPAEKNDPLFNHLRNMDLMNRTFGDIEAIHHANTRRSNEEDQYDLEAQSRTPSTMDKSLTRADTAAWVTKHPSRIPDDGNSSPPQYYSVLRTNGSDEEEGVDVYCGI
jgi:hypothetical protein